MKEKLQKIEKNKLIMISGFLFLVIVILFGGAFVYNKFFYKRSYTEIENIMLEAAKTYLQQNPKELPQNLNDTISLSEDELVASENMDSIAEYLKDEASACSGTVNVTNINGKYRYASLLDCGKKHTTTKLIDYIQKNVPIVESGNGLYNINNELVYRGDNVNNYIKFSGKTYRIIKFSNEHAIIIYTEKLEGIEWDDRYNIEKEDISGINDYSVSRIREYLDNLYKGTELISNENKLLVTAHNLGIGKRNESDTDKSGSLENQIILENQFIGLISINDFLNASLDNNCTTTTSRSCINYNYLSKYKYNWWTMTANSTDSYKVYRIQSTAQTTPASNTAYVRPVLYLAKDAILVSGNGSKEKPYTIR